MKKIFLQFIANTLLQMLNQVLGTESFDEIYELACGLNFYALEFHNIELN
jgi:hypothetical protein